MGRGKYFTWQCDDDLYAPDFLEDIHSTLVKFNFPPCVFTSYEFIHGTSFPDTEYTALSGQKQAFSGRQFLRMYWSGKIKAIGCNGVYDKGYLKRIGGVKGLADTNHPIYSEYLLLVQIGLLKQIAYINKPLIKYRVHEGSWGCASKDLSLFKQASENLIRESITVFSNPELRDDFYQNITSVLKFVVTDYIIRLKMQDGILIRFEAVPYLISLKKQFNSLKGSSLYWSALVSWGCTGMKLTWWLRPKFDINSMMSAWFARFTRTLRFHILRNR